MPINLILGVAIGSPSTSGGGAPYSVRSVSRRTLLPNEFSGTNPWVLAETSHPLVAPVTSQIEIWWPNWYVTVGGGAPFSGVSEIATGSTATATAQITYVDAVSGSPVVVNMLDKAGGTTSLSATDGGFFKATATINASAGSRILPRIRANFPNGMPYAQNVADLTNGDRFQFGASVPSLSTTPTQTFSTFWYGPCLIIALANNVVIGIVGDSRDAGIYDTPNDSYGDNGQFSRLFGRYGVAYTSVASPGERARTFAGNTDNSRRLAILAASGFTATAMGLAVNDLGDNTSTAAQIFGYNQTIAAALGKPVIWKTIDPWTTGGITTPLNGTFETAREAYNTLVRAQPTYFDVSGVLENPVTAGAWASADVVYTDYLHEVNTGNSWGAINGAIVGSSVAVFGIPSRAKGTVYPSVIAPVNTVAPSITNPSVQAAYVVQGQTLTAGTGTWTGTSPTFTYQWRRAGVNISGETASTYVVQAADDASALDCVVTASNAAGNASATTSNAPVGIAGTLILNDAMASQGTWSSTGGYSWSGGKMVITASTAFNSSEKTLGGMTAGKTLRCMADYVLTGGGLRWQIHGSTFPQGSTHTTSGTYTDNITAPASPVGVQMQTTAVTSGSVDNALIVMLP